MSPDQAPLLPVIAHLAGELDGEVGLAALAEVAGRSPFHLQRRFRAAFGETPRQLAERLRLECAAAQLVASDAPILDIALDVGFASHEVFARTFRRRYAMSPREYRARGSAGAGPGHVALTRSIGPCLRLFGAAPTERIPMSYEIVRVVLPEQPILFVRRKVKHSEIAKTLGEVLPAVFGHAHRQGIALAGPPFCRYAAWGPMITLEAGMPVATHAPGDGEIEAGVLHGGPAARTTHVGAYERLGDAHVALEQWLDAHKLTRAGAPWESYVTDPGQHPDPAQWRTEVVLAIA